MATNIYNPSTGQTGYQVPGAALQPGWQWNSTASSPSNGVQWSSPTSVNLNISGIQSQLKAGTMTIEDAKAQIQSAATAFATSNSPQGTMIDGTKLQSTLQSLNSQVFSNLGNIPQPDGQVYSVDANGNSSKVSTTVRQSTTTGTGTTVNTSAQGNYTVKSGDTLNAIAAKNGMSTSQLIALNPQISNPNLIMPGQSIILSGNTSSGTTGTSGTGSTGGTTGGTGGTGSTTLDQAATDALKFLGWSDQQIQSQMQTDPSSTQQWAMTAEYLKKQYDLGNATQGATAQAITDAYTKASTDPIIAAKYSDLSKLDTQAFYQALSQTATAASGESQTNQMQFEADRKALAEAQASKGTAYSGFRQQAQNNLATTEAGIVTSSRAKYQKSVNDLTSAFEAKYGSALTAPASVGFNNANTNSSISASGLLQTPPMATENITGALAGGITGTITGQKAADITARQQEILQGLAPATVKTS